MGIATNRPHDARVSALIAQLRSGGFRPLLWEDIGEALIERALNAASNEHGPDTGMIPRSGSLISLLEQRICAEAEVFQPSWPSSWDEFVIGLRLKAGRKDAFEHADLIRSKLASRDERMSCEGH